MSECPRCHQPVDHRPLGDVELLGAVIAALGAVGDPDPFRVLDVIASRVPSSVGRLQVAALTIRLLARVGDPKRARRLASAEQMATAETEALDELWSSPAAGLPQIGKDELDRAASPQVNQPDDEPLPQMGKEPGS